MLEVAALTSHYGRIHALAGIDLKVADGELVALVGANGAGKTTLLRAISGVQPYSGKIIYNGKDIGAVSSERRVGLGIVQVPEGRQVFGPLSVEDNLRLGAYTRTRAESDAELERVYVMFPSLNEPPPPAPPDSESRTISALIACVSVRLRPAAGSSSSSSLGRPPSARAISRRLSAP